MPKTAPRVSPLIYADSETSADQLYFTGLVVPDPFISFALGRTKAVVLSALEYARGRKEAAVDLVLSLEEWQEKARKRFRVPRASAADVIACLAVEMKLGVLRVPAEFPAGVLRGIEARRVKVEVAEGAFLPQREVKSDREAEAIAQGNRVAAAGIAAAEALLREAKVKGGRLVHRGRQVTSELLKEQIEVACLRAGGAALHTIAAAGDQACDPHGRGTGPIAPGQLIIIDVFPRVQATGYFGDMTRTFLKGVASEEQRRLVAAVREAQLAALKEVRAGVTGKKVHQAVLDVFKRLGWETTRDERGPRGFFHGTGHGLGLAIHEPPRMNPTGPKLREGTVVTVEPGLYYPGLGGARIEDVVQVTRGEPKLLSDYGYDWELP